MSRDGANSDPGPLWPFLIALAVLAAASILAVAIAHKVQGAPIPTRKPAPVILSMEALAGRWNLVWSGSSWQADLNKDGFWTCAQGTTWKGYWAFENGHLRVAEATEGGTWLRWRAKLKESKNEKKKLDSVAGDVWLSTNTTDQPSFQIKLARPKEAERLKIMPKSE